MNEEIKKLRQSINTVNAKVSFLREGVVDLEKSVKDLTADLDSFIEIFVQYKEEVDKRFERIEKHVGL